MSEKNLELPLDIHGGGQDLIFPHHENEIAQSEAATGLELGKYWVHNGFVQINSEKMSKSLNNFKTIRDILEFRQPETLRFFLLGKHYRSPIDFSFDAMDDSERALKRVYECMRDVKAASERASWKNGDAPADVLDEFEGFEKGFREAMDDDLNTAAALGHVSDFQLLAGITGNDTGADSCSHTVESAGVGHDYALDVLDNIAADEQTDLLRHSANDLRCFGGGVGQRDGFGAAHSGTKLLVQDI